MGSFELRKTADGKYLFLLIGSNGQVISCSNLYGSRKSALSAIESVRKIAADARTVERRV